MRDGTRGATEGRGWTRKTFFIVLNREGKRVGEGGGINVQGEGFRAKFNPFLGPILRFSYVLSYLTGAQKLTVQVAGIDLDCCNLTIVIGRF